jgi:hypothetical protein
VTLTIPVPMIPTRALHVPLWSTCPAVLAGLSLPHSNGSIEAAERYVLA